MKINIQKDSIEMNGKSLKVTTTLNELCAILGEYDDFQDLDKSGIEYVWNNTGIRATINKNNVISDILFYLEGCNFKRTVECYHGDIFIDDKNFEQCNWKYDEGIGELKCGIYNLYVVKDDNNKIVMFEIEYKTSEVKSKSNKYKLKKKDIEELTFSSFNFKLAVIQKLMYEKELLKPKFDVYEFVEEYNRRDIDIEEEGYEPIKEVIRWFKKYQIPYSLADEIDSIIMDGGNDIYHQIIPFWDGEDDYFDVKKVTLDDALQLKNLKKMVLMSSNIKKIQKSLAETDIEIEGI